MKPLGFRVLAVGLITILVTLLLAQTAVAQLPDGIDPNHPIELTLVPGQTSLRTGQLPAGQEVWFAVKSTDLLAQYDGLDNAKDRPPLDLTLFVTPANRDAVRHIHMELFPASYAAQWSAGRMFQHDFDDSGEETQPTPFGAGRVIDRAEEDYIYVSGDGDPLMGQLTWSGNVNNNETILICIQNGNATPVEYMLYTDNVIDMELGQPAVAEAAIAAQPLPDGIDPNHPIELTLVPDQTSLRMGQLPAGQEVWFAVKSTDLLAQYDGLDNAKDRPPLDLTLFVTPADRDAVRHIHMELFPASYAAQWSAGRMFQHDFDDSGEEIQPTPFGAGRVIDRAEEDYIYVSGDGDPLMGQLTWSGNVNNNETILVCIQNGNATPVEYILYTDNVIDMEF